MVSPAALAVLRDGSDTHARAQDPGFLLPVKPHDDPGPPGLLVGTIVDRIFIVIEVLGGMERENGPDPIGQPLDVTKVERFVPWIERPVVRFEFRCGGRLHRRCAL